MRTYISLFSRFYTHKESPLLLKNLVEVYKHDWEKQIDTLLMQVRCMKRGTFDSFLFQAVRSHLIHLSNLLNFIRVKRRVKRRSCGELNAAVRFSARKDLRLSRYYSQYYLLSTHPILLSLPFTFISPSSNSKRTE